MKNPAPGAVTIVIGVVLNASNWADVKVTETCLKTDGVDVAAVVWVVPSAKLIPAVTV
jgi:hypothetical protein